jgi:histone deacetylase 11
MHSIIDGICFILGILAFIFCFIKFQPDEVPYYYYCPIPIIWIIVYPIIIEIIYNLISNCPGRVEYNVYPSSRFVFHPQYDITFCGIEKLHPFDSQKYGNVYHRLIAMKLISE